jgi:hypothetical protein
MQIQEIEIINTLETLSSVNVMLHFHRTQEQPSENAIMNYEIRRQDLLEQLNELLASYEVILYARPQSAA